MSVGISIASTWNDQNCDRRYNAAMLVRLGQERAALALMCQESTVRQAIEATGEKCPTKPQ
jgi:hypothetical protein